MKALYGVVVGAALALGAIFSTAEAAPASAGAMLASEAPVAMVEQAQHRHYHYAPRRHYRAPTYNRHYYRAPPRHYHRPPARYYPHRHYAPRPYVRPHRHYRY